MVGRAWDVLFGLYNILLYIILGKLQNDLFAQYEPISSNYTPQNRNNDFVQKKYFQDVPLSQFDGL